MADIIRFRGKPGGDDNFITLRPFEFRWGDWGNAFVFMCSRSQSARLEEHRPGGPNTRDRRRIRAVPTHVTLDGGTHYTVTGLFAHREDESSMRRIYRLAGMMECVTKSPSPILRTDLLRRFFRTIEQERDRLGIVWKGSVRNFLIPLESACYKPERFQLAVSGARSLSELFLAIQTETDAQFDILSRRYVFYVPEGFL